VIFGQNSAAAEGWRRPLDSYDVAETGVHWTSRDSKQHKNSIRTHCVATLPARHESYNSSVLRSSTVFVSRNSFCISSAADDSVRLCK